MQVGQRQRDMAAVEVYVAARRPRPGQRSGGQGQRGQISPAAKGAGGVLGNHLQHGPGRVDGQRRTGQCGGVPAGAAAQIGGDAVGAIEGGKSFDR